MKIKVENLFVVFASNKIIRYFFHKKCDINVLKLRI